MSKYRELAKDIVKNVGGESNIAGLVHCATRLRFQLKDMSKADKATMESMQGVLSVVVSGGQFQVVIGTHVSKVYEEIMGMTNITKANPEDMPKPKLFDRVFSTISRSFGPLLGAMAGAGMIKALLAVLVMTGVFNGTESTYIVLMGAANAAFYFLPIFLGITVAQNLGANPYVGGAIGASLLEPSIAALSAAEVAPDIFGIPLVMINYSSTVFPIFIAVAIYAPFEKQLKKVIPMTVQMFLVPLISLLVIVPLTLLVFGPFGVYIGTAIGQGIAFLNTKSAILTGAVMGAAWLPLTVMGLHWGLVPVFMYNLANGGDPLAAMVSATVFAQLGVVLGIFVRSKDKEERALATTTFVTGALSGVTEPIIYGFLTKYKRTLGYVIASGAAGGAVIATMGVKATAFAMPSVLAIPVFTPMVSFVIGILTAFGLGFSAVLVFGFKDKKSAAAEDAAPVGKPVPTSVSDSKLTRESNKEDVIFSPIKGSVVALSSIEDEVFASGAMGKGVAIKPAEGKVYAPVDGVISVMFPTGHAIGLSADSGAELLIHVGLNTVQLEGKHFSPKVEQGQKVKRGDLILEFDLKEIKKAGYSTSTPVIVTNSDNYNEVNCYHDENGSDLDVTIQEEILTIVG